MDDSFVLFLFTNLVMSKKQKRALEVFRKPAPAYLAYQTIDRILRNCGFELVNQEGSHCYYARPVAPQEIKTIIHISGRKVARTYFSRVRDNVAKYCPELLGGQR
jgi:predicted RNA binding protein YcfA (HicA-like mRNA interferase family)